MNSRAGIAPVQPLGRIPASTTTIEIGGIAVRLRSDKPGFDEVLSSRYAGFLSEDAAASSEFDILLQSSAASMEPELQLSKRGCVWRIERGDLAAEWNAVSRRGWVRQEANPYSIDAVLRIVHTLLLAEEGGFLLHASSVVRNGRAFLFTGVSGAGKTTISQLAPPDAVLLTDEISYIRRSGDGYRAYGTPFAGSLQRSGENVSAPIGGAFLLEKGRENCLASVDTAMAARSLLRNILFFARDTDLVKRVFEAAVEFVSCVPVQRLAFAPDERVWDLIR
ncbi:MAG: hypothetical protein ACRD8A_16875 [Candidatus Acidiferrales bacterium]